MLRTLQDGCNEEARLQLKYCVMNLTSCGLDSRGCFETAYELYHDYTVQYVIRTVYYSTLSTVAGRFHYDSYTNSIKNFTHGTISMAHEH